MWAQVVNLLVGIWLMVAPGFFGFPKLIASNDQIAGPLIASFAIVALTKVTHGARKVNILLGVWLIASPFILEYDNIAATINDIASGVVAIAMALVKAKIDQTFGGGWQSLFQSSK